MKKRLISDVVRAIKTALTKSTDSVDEVDQRMEEMAGEFEHLANVLVMSGDDENWEILAELADDLMEV